MMSWQDIVNGSFELGGGMLMWLNVAAIRRDKCIRGVSLIPCLLFTAWGWWNIYYYGHLSQWASWTGGIILVLANTVWIYHAWKYRNNNKEHLL
jgi:hypothetical protein